MLGALYARFLRTLLGGEATLVRCNSARNRNNFEFKQGNFSGEYLYCLGDFFVHQRPHSVLSVVKSSNDFTKIAKVTTSAAVWALALRC